MSNVPALKSFEGVSYRETRVFLGDAMRSSSSLILVVVCSWFGVFCLCDAEMRG